MARPRCSRRRVTVRSPSRTVIQKPARSPSPRPCPKFDGDSTSISFPITVTQPTTTTTLSASAASAKYGQSLTFTATVTGAGTPTGSVAFYSGAVTAADQIGSGTLMLTGGQYEAMFSTTALHVIGSPYTITAVYGGDPSHLGSTSTAVHVTITPAPLVITANNQTKVYGQADPTLTVGYAGLVNGDTPASLTTPPKVTTTATTLSPVSGSPYAITASGAVDPDYTISYVGGKLTINQDATTTVATSSPSSPSMGQSVKLAATVNPNAPGSGTPTGSVTFVDTTTGANLGTVKLSGGVASLSTTNLAPGSNTITVSYGGDPNFLASTTTETIAVVTPSILILNSSAPWP